MVYIKTWLLFIRVILAYLLAPSSLSKYSLAGKKLFSQSFRYSKKEQSSFRFFVSCYLRSLRAKKVSLTDACHLYGNGSHFFYDNNPTQANENKRKTHIEYFTKESINGSVWKFKLLGCFKISDKFFQIVFESLLLVFLLPIFPFVKYKGSVALMFVEYVELTNLLIIIDSYKIDTLYYYSIYEKDSNISSIVLKSKNVQVIKVTSLTPLKFWNSIIVATDKLMLCDPNQLEEIETFKTTIQVNKVELWGPESIGETVDYYVDGKNHTTKKNTVGFYSTASYLRVLNNDIDQNNMKANEDRIKTYLVEYIKEKPDVELIVFLHPKERKQGLSSIVTNHYSACFNGIKYSIYDGDLQSYQCFNLVDLGVSMYSSVIYERLYYGFKCVMMPFGENGFTLPGSINNICATDKIDFFAKIDSFLDVSLEQYFKFTGLVKSGFVENILDNKKDK